MKIFSNGLILYENYVPKPKKPSQWSQAFLSFREHNQEREHNRDYVPRNIISKVILRHSNLAITQRYLGNVSDTEAMRWIDNLYT